ncbi:hypothetical protein [Rhodococcus qingshengii]|uniref:hypothetical protein n=1 Tax=Rhodococcus qingshengii TaxID=334542 RepID=UPI0009F1BF5C|nr:hypothetical protein [Rhodococcus qingshengii]ORC17763.1 hypothetical protein BXO91_27120 [Rhodococcus qingshengii]
MQWVEDLDPYAPGVRRINLTCVGELPSDMVKHLARLEDRRVAELQRVARRTTVSSFRKRPTNLQPILQVNDTIFFPPHPSSGIRFELANIRIYENGTAFDIRARGNATPGLAPSQTVYVGPWARSKKRHGAYLGLVLPDGRVVTNKTCRPQDAPEDSDTSSPWLHGSAGYSFDSGVGATYFLSPTPAPNGTITISLSYPEVGVDAALSLSVESNSFIHPSS